jgi:hypothetical protein
LHVGRSQDEEDPQGWCCATCNCVLEVRETYYKGGWNIHYDVIDLEIRSFDGWDFHGHVSRIITSPDVPYPLQLAYEIIAVRGFKN